MNVKHKVQIVGADAVPPTPKTPSQQAQEASFLSALGISENPGTDAPDENLNNDSLSALGPTDAKTYQDYLGALSIFFSGMAYSDIVMILGLFKTEVTAKCVFISPVVK